MVWGGVRFLDSHVEMGKNMDEQISPTLHGRLVKFLITLTETNIFVGSENSNGTKGRLISFLGH